MRSSRLGAHREQGAHATLVPGSTRLDALTNPDLFLGQFLVEQGVFLRFVLQGFFFSTQIVMEIAGPAD